ncbi:hypothetical protein K190097F3_56740 [Enterocloster clostridioformis]
MMENSKVFSAYKWYIVSQIKFEQCKEISGGDRYAVTFRPTERRDRSPDGVINHPVCRIYNDKVDKYA